jgi:hypothetical protein
MYGIGLMVLSWKFEFPKEKSDNNFPNTHIKSVNKCPQEFDRSNRKIKNLKMNHKICEIAVK